MGLGRWGWQMGLAVGLATNQELAVTNQRPIKSNYRSDHSGLTKLTNQTNLVGHTARAGLSASPLKIYPSPSVNE